MEGRTSSILNDRSRFVLRNQIHADLRLADADERVAQGPRGT